MNITTLGIDLAKNVFQLHGIDAQGKVMLKKKINRLALADFIAQLPKCLIGMEACGGSHYWARKFQSFGHTVRLISVSRTIESLRSPPPQNRTCRATASGSR